MTYVRVPQSSVADPSRSGAGRAGQPVAGVLGQGDTTASRAAARVGALGDGAALAGQVAGRLIVRRHARIAQERVVDQPRPRVADEVQRARDDDGPAAASRAPASSAAPAGRRLGTRTVRPRAPARPATPSARAVRRERPWRVHGRAHDRRPVERRATAATARTVASTSLSAIAAQTSVTGRRVACRREERAEVVERLGEGRGAVRVVRAVEEHLAAAVRPSATSSSRPGQRAAA